MSEVADTTSPPDGCNYPGGCARQRRPDSATGRPSRYCEQADADGGPVHNRTNAFKARRGLRGTVATREDDRGLAAPVSMARATLEQRLAELPERVTGLRQHLDDIMAGIRSAGDVEAAGAEVEDAHRDALTKVTEAERRATAAERAVRAADERVQMAERERDEADALAEEAMAETARVRDETQSVIAAIRAEADAAVVGAQEQLVSAEAGFASRLAQRDTDVEQAHRDTNTARVGAASAQAGQRAADETAARERELAAQLRQELDQTRRDTEDARQRMQAEIESAHQAGQEAAVQTAALRVELAATQAQAVAAQRASEADRESVASLNRKLERQRTDARSEREALRTNHAEQLAQSQRSADERLNALTALIRAPINDTGTVAKGNPND